MYKIDLAANIEIQTEILKSKIAKYYHQSPSIRLIDTHEINIFGVVASWKRLEWWVLMAMAGARVRVVGLSPPMLYSR